MTFQDFLIFRKVFGFFSTDDDVDGVSRSHVSPFQVEVGVGSGKVHNFYEFLKAFVDTYLLCLVLLRILSRKLETFEVE